MREGLSVAGIQMKEGVIRAFRRTSKVTSDLPVTTTIAGGSTTHYSAVPNKGIKVLDST